MNGQYSEYDQNKSVIIVPLEDQRFQSVIGEIRELGASKEGVAFSSRVCDYRDDINLKELLEQISKCWHSKLAIINDYVQIEASTYLDETSESVLKEMITEVANEADKLEFKLTGLDVN